MSEKSFEQRIADKVVEQLGNGMVEKLIEQKLEKGISEALESIFGWNGAGKKAIEHKLAEVMVPAIDKHDFNKYLVKMDRCLTELVNNTSFADNREILKNFQGLMKEPEKESVTLTEIFEQYKKHVAANVDTSELEEIREEGELYYSNVEATMDVERDDKSWLRSTSEGCRVSFACEQDESLNCQIRLFKFADDNKWSMSSGRSAIDINSLRYMSDFEIFLNVLMRGFNNVVVDVDWLSDDDIEPDEKPEY